MTINEDIVPMVREKINSKWILWAVGGGIATIFTLGVSIGTTVMAHRGLPDRVSIVEQDQRGMVCLLAATIDEGNPMYCEIFLSEETRIVLQNLRNGRDFTPMFDD